MFITIPFFAASHVNVHHMHRSEMLQWVLQQHDKHIAPTAAALRRQFLHADCNEDNVLVDAESGVQTRASVDQRAASSR